jgi:hypothetical protein
MMLKFKPSHFRHLQVDDEAFGNPLRSDFRNSTADPYVSTSNEKAFSNSDSAFRTEASSSTIATRACWLHMRDISPGIGFVELVQGSILLKTSMT